MRPTAGSMSFRHWRRPWWPAASTTSIPCGTTSRKRRRWSANCAAPAALAGTPRQQVEAIFEFLHERVLYGGYDLAYTDLRRVLDDGRFNCVSATVLMNYLAGQLGLDCRGLEMPGHAMTRVRLADGTLDIETTCPHWFRLMDDSRQPSAAVTKTIGAAAAGDRSKAREVSPAQMAAMIYYNRGVDLLNEKRFAEAARANAKALQARSPECHGARQPLGDDQ